MTNLVLTLWITAYCFSGHRCANGEWPVAGQTCAAPRSVPFGSAVVIDGHRWRVTDRTTARHNETVDLYYGLDIRGAKEWGRRRMKVRIEEK